MDFVTEKVAPLPPPTIDTQAVFEAAYKPSEKEHTAIRAFVECYSDFAEVPPGKILRFLRARDMQDKKAATMLRHLRQRCHWLRQDSSVRTAIPRASAV